MGKTLRFGTTRNDKQLRLFNKKSGGFNKATVHEKIKVTGPVRTLKHSIIHFSYDNLSDYFVKFNRYTDLVAKKKFKEKRNYSKLFVALRFPLGFLQLYIFRGSIFDGYPGFVWSILHALYSTIKYAKLVELIKLETDSRT
jgi:hypothetical protein